MTSITANGFSFHSTTARRTPRTSFAARLAALQARHEQAPHPSAVFGAATRGALALVPFMGLAWVFVTI